MLSAYWVRTGRAAVGTITGTVFQDYNSNGIQDTARAINNAGAGSIGVAIDRGIAGVTVTAYNSSGAVAGTATTDNQGNYSLVASGNAPYRIEFTDLPAGFKPGPAGPNSGTTVQFVATDVAGNVSLGLIIPAEYCQDNPTLATGCYVGGDQNFDLPVIISFPYSSGTARETGGAPFSDFDQPAHDDVAVARQVGTTWGLAYARSERRLYAAAFFKRHTGFGPAGTGAIYQIDPSNSAVSVYADLNAIFGAGTAGIDAHDRNDYDRDNGNSGWDAVGKTSLGGLAASDDEKKLYVMSLADRQLYELPLDVLPTSANVRRRAAPTNPPGCASATDVRPFAVAFNGGQVYVGMVCSAESTITQAAPEGDATKLMAYVYSVNPATLDFSTAPVFQTALNYPRRCADSAQLGTANCFSAAWRAWTPAYRNIGTSVDVGLPNLSRGIYPQPMLTDLAFENGNLILGLRDRAGDQFGNATLDNPAESVLRYYGVSAGDTLKACGSPATGWTLESNGRCGGTGVAPQNSGEGPGGGEFYFRDESVPYTDEVFMGGMAQIPGFPDVVINSFDPIPIFDLDNLFDGGTRWHSNASGVLRKTYRIYNGSIGLLAGPFGKANGLSDVAVLCDPAPIEIGNRIWQDTNGNGVQEPNEPGLANLRVRLLKNGIQVGETTTNGRGEFVFNGTNVSPVGVLPNMTYEITVDTTQTPIGNFTLTKPNSDSSPNGDSRDSDAVQIGSSAVIRLTTGAAGDNDHTFDVGFVPSGGPLTIACPPNVTATVTVAGATSAVVNYPAPTVTPPNTPVTCTPPSGSTFPVGTTTVNCTVAGAGGSASCSFVVTVAPMMVKSSKCDAICFRSPQYYLLNIGNLPGGTVLIGGVNNNQPVSTDRRTLIAQALQGSPVKAGLTPLQLLNQEFVAAQLSINNAGGAGSPVAYNAFWSMLSCYNINFTPVTLSNGATLSTASMLNDLFEQAQSAIRQNRAADYDKIAAVLDLLNGNDLLGRCGR